MELHQILFDWPKCVNDWEMLWPAVVASCSRPILTSKQSSEKVLPPYGLARLLFLLFFLHMARCWNRHKYWVLCRYWMDRGFFLLEPKSWVSSLNIPRVKDAPKTILPWESRQLICGYSLMWESSFYQHQRGIDSKYRDLHLKHLKLSNFFLRKMFC